MSAPRPEAVLTWPGSGTNSGTVAAIGTTAWFELVWSTVTLQNLSGVIGGTGELHDLSGL